MERRNITGPNVAVRKLVLELGIEGDTEFQSKLKEFNDFANNLSKILETIEKQLLSIGKTLPGLGTYTSFYAGGGSGGSVLTPSERLESQQQQTLISQQVQKERERSDEQLKLSQQSVNLQEKIIESLESQREGRSGIFQDALNQIADLKRTHREELQKTDDLLTKSLEYVAVAKRPPHTMGGTPEMSESIYDPEIGAPRKVTREAWKQFQAPKFELLEGIKERLEATKVAIPELEQAKIDADLDALRDKYENSGSDDLAQDIEQYKKYQNAMKSILAGLNLKSFEEFKRKMEDVNINEEITDIEDIPSGTGVTKKYPETIRPEDIHPFEDVPETPTEIIGRNQPEESVEDIEAEIARLKGTGKEEQVDKKKDLLNKVLNNQYLIPGLSKAQTLKLLSEKGEIDLPPNIQAIVFRPPSTGAEPAGDVETTKGPTSDLTQELTEYMVKAQHATISVPEIEQDKSVTTPELQRIRIGKRLENEAQRKRIQKEALEIEGEMQKEIDHEEVIRERGFAFEPEERIRDLQTRAENWIESKQESLKKSAIGFLSEKMPRIFKTSEQYLEEQEQGRKEKAREFIEKAEKRGDIEPNIVNITINNPTITRDEQIEEMIQQMQLAFRGTRSE